jgi:hypothetical protein
MDMPSDVFMILYNAQQPTHLYRSAVATSHLTLKVSAYLLCFARRKQLHQGT